MISALMRDNCAGRERMKRGQQRWQHAPRGIIIAISSPQRVGDKEGNEGVSFGW